LQTVGLALAVTDCEVEVVTVFVTRISANEQTRDSAIYVYTTRTAASITCSATCNSALARTLVVVNRDKEDDSFGIIDVPSC